jgi:hypothetical protein
MALILNTVHGGMKMLDQIVKKVECWWPDGTKTYEVVGEEHCTSICTDEATGSVLLYVESFDNIPAHRLILKPSAYRVLIEEVKIDE